MLNNLVVLLQMLVSSTFLSFCTRTVALPRNRFTMLLVGLNFDRANVYVLYPAFFNNGKYAKRFHSTEKGQGALIFLAIIAVLAIIIMAMAVPLLDTFQATYLH